MPQSLSPSPGGVLADLLAQLSPSEDLTGVSWLSAAHRLVLKVQTFRSRFPSTGANLLWIYSATGTITDSQTIVSATV